RDGHVTGVQTCALPISCFDALYAVMYLPPPSPATDAMLTTRPQPRASIPGRNAWMHRNGPVAFTVRIRCQSSSVVFCTDAEWLRSEERRVGKGCGAGRV